MCPPGSERELAVRYMVHAHAHAHMRCAGACDHVHVLTGRRHSVTEGWYRIESRWVLVSIRESSRELHEMDAEAVPQRPVVIDPRRSTRAHCFMGLRFLTVETALSARHDDQERTRCIHTRLRP